MKMHYLLALPLALQVAACSPRPAATAASREEALDKCEAVVEDTLLQVKRERELYASNPAYYQRLEDDDYGSYLDTFEWSFLLSNRYEEVQVLRGFCHSFPNSKHDGLWRVSGSIEYLTRPRNGANSSVDRVHITGSGASYEL